MFIIGVRKKYHREDGFSRRTKLAGSELEVLVGNSSLISLIILTR
jgi:hypothetical protein